MGQISLQSIQKTFGQTPVLKGVDLEIEEGEFLTLVGPSGCGKSTLLRILAGLEAPTAGQVMIDGQDVTRMRPASRNLAMVFQSYALYPHLTVAENMMTPLKLRDIGTAGRLPVLGPLIARSAYRGLRAKVNETAETLQIQNLLDRKPGQLSGGQRQRAALGRAMVRNPVAFLMDEPLSNLDAALRVHMRAELSDLHRRLKTTFVYVTHDQAEALTMSDRMAVMMDGHILQLGKPDDIYRNPQSLAVARFVGSPAINTMPAEIDGAGTLRALDVSLLGTNAQAGLVTLGIRPEHLSIDPSGAFYGVVTHRENLGSDLFIHLGVNGLEQKIVVRAAPDTRAKIGQTLRFSTIRDKIMMFDGSGARLPEQTMLEVA